MAALTKRYPPPKRRKIEPDMGLNYPEDLASASESEDHDQQQIELHDYLEQQRIELPNYLDLKSNNAMWESPPLYTREGFKYILIIRPNGLKYTDSHNTAVGIWLKPVASDHDEPSKFPAKVKLGLRVGFGPDASSGDDEGLKIDPTDCSWKIEDTHSRYPVIAFKPTITHEALEKANCFVDENLILLIEEVE